MDKFVSSNGSPALVLPWIGRKVSRKHATDAGYWGLFITIILVCYKFFSDGSFSAILTLSSAFQCFAFALLLVKSHTQKSVAGLSSRSLTLYGVALFFRLLSTLFFNGYLPVDRSGDWVYQSADILSFFLIQYIVWFAFRRYDYSHQREHDTFPVLIPVIASLALALVVHPDLNSFFPADVSWTFALYIETFAMLPQLFMMTRGSGEVEALTSHYVACVAASRAFSFAFWLFSFKELAPVSPGGALGGINFPGYLVIGALGLQLLMFADFLYHYISSIRMGRKLVLPSIHI